MLGRLSLLGAIVLTLNISFISVANVAATEGHTTVASRPSQSELQSAINQLEQLGNYQTYFGPNSSITLSDQIPHYQEYLYLYNLVHSVQTLVNHYDDTDYLARHQVTDETFQDALIEMQHAYRGCSLIFGLNRTTSTNTSANVPTSTTDSPTTSNKPVAGTPNTSPSPVANDTAQSKATSQASVSTNNAQSDHNDATPTEVASPNLQASDNQQNTDIAVPATGEAAETAGLTTRRVSWPAFIAVAVTGAIIASTLITIIIRHEPRRHNRARRRY